MIEVYKFVSIELKRLGLTNKVDIERITTEAVLATTNAATWVGKKPPGVSALSYARKAAYILIKNYSPDQPLYSFSEDPDSLLMYEPWTEDWGIVGQFSIEDLQTVSEAVKTLNYEEFNLIQLLYSDAKTIDQAATELDIPVTRATKLYNDAIKKMRTHFEHLKG